MSTPLESLSAVLLRDLATLGREIEAYPDDAAPWVQIPGLPNAGGTLALHLCGNLRHYVGAVLGHTTYVRDRPAEFATRDVPRHELVRLVELTRAEVKAALATIPSPMLGQTYPETLGGVTLQTGEFLLHLLSHLNYHTGQIDYHRRAATSQNAGVGAVNMRELPTAVSGER